MQRSIEQSGLPSAVESEKLVLGSILLDSNGFMPTVMDVLEDSDFTVDKHRLIYRRCAAMFLAGEGVDHTTLATKLDALGELQSVDGLGYLISLDEGMPRLPNIDAYIATIREKSILRRTILAAQSTIDLCMSGTQKPDEMLARAEQSFRDLSARANAEQEFSTPEDIFMAAGGLVPHLRNRRVSGLPTHIQGLNVLTRGLQPASMNIVAAKTSRGKTAWALNLAAYVATRGKGVVIYSQEMAKEELLDRLICITGPVTFDDLYNAPVGDELRNAANRSLLPIYIRDMPATVPAIHAKTRRLMGQHPDIGLVIVDYLQLLDSTGRNGNRQEEVSGISRGLKLTASALHLPFVVLSQLSRGDGTVREPELRDLRESGSIENDANIVVFLHAEREFRDLGTHEPANVRLILAKQRNGPLGRVEMLFDRHTGRFIEHQEAA